MISIEGLNERQMKLLDVMWAIKTPEEYDVWKDSLSEDLQNEVESLAELVLFEYVEPKIGKYKEYVDFVLKKFALQK